MSHPPVPKRLVELAGELADVAGLGYVSVFAYRPEQGKTVYTLTSEFDEIEWWEGNGGSHVFEPHIRELREYEAEIALRYAIAGARWATRPDRDESEGGGA